MKIRVALPSDVVAVRSLLAQLGYADLSEQDALNNIRSHSEQGYRLLVAEVNSQVVGLIAIHWFDLFHWKEKIGRISTLCVDEAFRSQGIGKALMMEAESILASEGCIKAELTSNMRRERAHAFYLELGYEEDRRRFVRSLKPRS